MWSLADPVVLLALPAPLIARHFLPARTRDSGAVFLPATLATRIIEAGGGKVATRIRQSLPLLLWGLLVLALAGPQKLETSSAVPSSGRDIVLALDLSGSMEKQDFSLDGQPLSRLDAVKRAGAHFVRGRAGDRVGLVIFGDHAYFAAPLSYDTESVARSVENAVVGISGRSTAISAGLGLAIKRLSRPGESGSRVVVLLSDGVDTTGTVDAGGVAALAARHGIRVHTIALGPRDLETSPGARDAVDTATLRLIAEKSGGRTFRVTGMSDLSSVSDELNRLEPGLSARPPLTIQREYWTFPATVALLIAMVMIAFPGARP